MSTNGISPHVQMSPAVSRVPDNSEHASSNDCATPAAAANTTNRRSCSPRRASRSEWKSRHVTERVEAVRQLLVLVVTCDRNVGTRPLLTLQQRQRATHLLA